MGLINFKMADIINFTRAEEVKEVRNMSSADTKELIGRSFKHLMEKKAFDKITISDISNEAKINRQTFYYHFHDKYELLNTVFYNDIIVELIDGFSIDNWTEKFFTLLITIKNNAKFYKNALNTNYGNEFRTYLLDITQKLLYEFIEKLTEKRSIDDADRRYISKFFAYGITGIIIDWVTSGMKDSPEFITKYLEEIIDDCRILVVTKYTNRLN